MLMSDSIFAEEPSDARAGTNAPPVLDLTIDYGTVIRDPTRPEPSLKIDLDGPFVSDPGENSATRGRKRAARDAEVESGGDPYLLNSR